MTFFLAPSKHFLSLPASDKQAVGHIWSYKSVVPCGRTVVSSMHCGCSNPGSNLGQGSILLSGSRNMTLLFATSSYSWILCLKLTGVLCCLPAAKTAGRLQTEVLAQNSWEVPTCNLFHAQAVLAAGRQHRTPVSFRHKIQLKNEVAKFREMFLNARHQKAALTQLRTWVVAATMHRTNHYTTTANHWLTAANRAYGVLVRCREGAKKLARDE